MPLLGLLLALYLSNHFYQQQKKRKKRDWLARFINNTRARSLANDLFHKKGSSSGWNISQFHLAMMPWLNFVKSFIPQLELIQPQLSMSYKDTGRGEAGPFKVTGRGSVVVIYGRPVLRFKFVIGLCAGGWNPSLLLCAVLVSRSPFCFSPFSLAAQFYTHISTHAQAEI